MKNNIPLRTVWVTLMLILLSGCASSYNHLDELREEHAAQDCEYLNANLNIPDHPLSLEEVIEIALCRNLDLLVKEFEIAVQKEIASSENLKMLPSLRMNYEMTSRNKNTGSSSESLTDRPPAPPSISTDQDIRKWDATLTWNILDFGLSYIRARQEANRALVKEMEYCRLSQNLILEVTKQFWKLVISNLAVERSSAIIMEASQQREMMRLNAKRRYITQKTDFEKEDQLLRIERTIRIYEKNAHIAKSELSQLMGLPPGTEFEIQEVHCREVDLDLGDICELETLALLHRPELYGNDLEEKIDADLVRTSLMRMFPGVNLFVADNWNSNSYLINNYWLEAGLRTAWDLLTLPSLWKEKKGAERKKDQTRATRLALSMGAITQVYLAYLVYHDDLKVLSLAKEHYYVKDRLFEIAKNQTRVGLMGRAGLVEYRADALELEVAALEAYANVQVSLEQLNNAIGIPGHFRLHCEENLCDGGSHVAFSP